MSIGTATLLNGAGVVLVEVVEFVTDVWFGSGLVALVWLTPEMLFSKLAAGVGLGVELLSDSEMASTVIDAPDAYSCFNGLANCMEPKPWI